MKNLIMLVDDEPNLRYLLRQMLELGGFNVVEAIDGLEALEKLEEVAPDLMILDVMMPNMDGVSLCKKLRAGTAFARLPIIMLSGKTQHRAVQEGLAAGADQYLRKPITIEELLQSVRALLPAPSSISERPEKAFIPKKGNNF